MLEQMSQAQLNVLVDGGVTAERAYEFNWMCSYLRRTSQALIAAAMNASGYSAIVAAALDADVQSQAMTEQAEDAAALAQLRDQLAAIDPDSLTPREALDALYRLKQHLT
ncbi:hypothetical protein AZ19_1718 [Bordetella bronchiseptica E012]|nr:hypothetical protein AZ19_1718 [Bordetella bronchiseptica E012]